MYNELDNILKTMSLMEENLSVLAGRVFYYRNENTALNKHIAHLEKENDSLRNKRDYTVAKLNNLMQKLEEAGYKY